MYYAILIYAQEGVWEQLSPEQQEAALQQHQAMQAEYSACDMLGPVVRLGASNGAVTLRHKGDVPLVTDGPFAETKEHLLGIYTVCCQSLDQAIEAAGKLPQGIASYEVRPIRWSSMEPDTDHGHH